MEKKGFIAEFKEFISRGSVMDLAVGVVVGGAFTAIVNSLVNDIIMPIIGIIVGGIDFSSLVITLKEAQGEAAAVTLNIGAFIQSVINFLLIAIVIFMMIEGINKLRRTKEEDAPAPAEPETPADIKLLTEIRDLLRKE